MVNVVGIVPRTHAIELTRELDLSNEPLSRINALCHEMEQAAVAFGQAFLAKETELDQAFAAVQVERERLRLLLTDIASLQGELRSTHLQYHLAVASCRVPIRLQPMTGYAATGTPRAGRPAAMVTSIN